MPVPFEGLRVIDMGDYIAAPYCARLLGDGGADVVKVEPPGGDSARRSGPFLGDKPGPDRSALFAYLNRGKRSVVADPSTPNGRSRVTQLLSQADVLVHHYVSLEASPVGMGSADLRKRHPGLVVVGIAPFGASGPLSRYRADNLVALSVGGSAHASPGFPDYAANLEEEPPLTPNASIAEFISGVAGAVGAVLGLLQRQATGLGDIIDISKQESIASLLAWNLAVYGYGGEIVGRKQMHARQAPNHFLPCADGWVALVAFMDKHWRKLVELMGKPDWAADPAFATGASRGAHWNDLEPLVLSWLLEQPRQEFFKRAQEIGIPSCPALSMAEACDNEQTVARRFLIPIEAASNTPGKLPGPLFVVDGQRTPVHAAVPSLGQHNEQAMSDWLQPGAGRVARATPRIPSASVQAPSGRVPQVLEGVRVIDFGQMIAVPLLGQWLGAFGAEVILVESRSNLPSRNFGPFAGEPSVDTSSMFNYMNRNKRSVTIDLRTPVGLDLARRLISTADVVQENFAPGTMEKLGLGYEALKRIKPNIIMLSSSAFGSTGPWKSYLALHSGVILLSGLGAVTGYAGGQARMVGSSLPDSISSLYAFLAVTQAIHASRRTGQGQHLELAMTELTQSLLPEAIAEWTMLGREPPRLGNRHGEKAPHGIYRAAGEDRWVAISVETEDEWQSLCRVIGCPDLVSDPRFADRAVRREHADALDAIITFRTRERDPFDLFRELQDAGVCAGPVYTERDLLTDSHLAARGFVVEDNHPTAGKHHMAGVPWRVHHLAPPASRPAPLLGADNSHVLGDLVGLTPEEIDTLVAARVVY